MKFGLTWSADSSLVATVRFFDLHLCRMLHNPIVTSVGLVGCAVGLNVLQLAAVGQRAPGLLFASDYYLDIVLNVINVVFVLRFSVARPTSPWIEWVLFVLNNIGTYVLTFTDYSLLRSDINVVFRVFLAWQHLCPYIIMLLNYFEVTGTPDEKLACADSDEKLACAATDEKHFKPLLLADTNDNFLPIFISHLYVLVNYSFPYVMAPALITLYKWCTFLLKFFCIYQFVLYELRQVYGLPRQYSEVYTPVQLDSRPRLMQRLYRHHAWFALAACVVVIGFDVVYVVMLA